MAIYVALGANQNAFIDDQKLKPAETFNYVLNRFAENGIEVRAHSGIWESPAWPDPDTQPPYENAVISVNTRMKPITLLDTLKDLEKAFGRKDTERNAARPLDLDILDYNGQISTSERLSLPHPRMCERPFVLLPLSEIAPNWRDPQKNRTIMDWIARLPLNDVARLTRLSASI